MQANNRPRRWRLAGYGLCGVVLGSLAILGLASRQALAGPWGFWRGRRTEDSHAPVCDDYPDGDTVGGTWYWLRSPDEEKRVVMGLFNQYCIRCHGVNGRGIWDIPGVPDFTNARWQESRSDGQIARIILEGRGAVMPPFRGALSLEEAWGLARHLRTFKPGTQVPRPDLGTGGLPTPKVP